MSSLVLGFIYLGFGGDELESGGNIFDTYITLFTPTFDLFIIYTICIICQRCTRREREMHKQSVCERNIFCWSKNKGTIPWVRLEFE